MGGFIDGGKQNLRLLQEHLARVKDIYQYIYSHVFPEIYTTSEKRGFDSKSNFHILFQAYRDKIMMRQQSLAKNLVTTKRDERIRTKTDKEPRSI